MEEAPFHNSVTLLQRPLKAAHFTGWQSSLKPEFNQFEVIRDEYERLKQLPVGKICASDDSLLT